jgi:hypothetical protein
MPFSDRADAGRRWAERGCTHLFEESGALLAVADLARQWFLAHLAARRCLWRWRLRTRA